MIYIFILHSSCLIYSSIKYHSSHLYSRYILESSTTLQSFRSHLHIHSLKVIVFCLIYTFPPPSSTVTYFLISAFYEMCFTFHILFFLQSFSRLQFPIFFFFYYPLPFSPFLLNFEFSKTILYLYISQGEFLGFQDLLFHL